MDHQVIFNPYKNSKSTIKFNIGQAMNNQVEKPSKFPLGQRLRSLSRKNSVSSLHSADREPKELPQKQASMDSREGSVNKKNPATRIELNAKSKLFSSLSGISKTIAVQKSSSRDNSSNMSNPIAENPLLGSRIEAMIGTRRRSNPNRLSMGGFMKSTSNLNKPQHSRVASSTASLLADNGVKAHNTATESSAKEAFNELNGHKLKGKLPSRRRRAAPAQKGNRRPDREVHRREVLGHLQEAQEPHEGGPGVPGPDLLHEEPGVPPPLRHGLGPLQTSATPPARDLRVHQVYAIREEAVGRNSVQI